MTAAEDVRCRRARRPRKDKEVDDSADCPENALTAGRVAILRIVVDQMRNVMLRIDEEEIIKRFEWLGCLLGRLPRELFEGA